MSNNQYNINNEKDKNLPIYERKQTKIRTFESRILNQYELSILEYSELYRQQEGKCAICSSQFSNDNPMNIDHSHETGKVRGLLCGNCNKGLGFLRDSIPYLEKALEYLIKSQKSIITLEPKETSNLFQTLRNSMTTWMNNSIKLEIDFENKKIRMI